MFISVFFYLFLISLSVSDLKFGIVPNKILLIFFSVIFCMMLSGDISAISINLLSASFVFFILVLVKHFTKGIGAGDIKLLFVTTFYSGFMDSLIAITVACCFGIAACLMLRFGKTVSSRISFAPFITVGYLSVDFLGKKVL